MLAVAWLCCVLGLAWIALAMDVHWRQLTQHPITRTRKLMLRTLGASALGVSLWLCFVVDHASIASLVWVMMLAAAALIVTFTLAWRAHWLAWLVWRTQGESAHRGERLHGR